eukprot:TRINITY_DN25033_c0_g1_i1.p1 TRINITY_DN25033_c0_g1~~TRINITY_DN25033_c0_g1_i1.p1  ORF type:complete len:120 (+),score=31.79 TRINITY_DN25033_c0_g1_i1:32-361(+)
MPGMDRKPFDFTIYVFEMLYGEDLVDTLLQSPYFNPALLRLKKQQENEFKKIQQEKEKKQEKDMEMEQDDNNNDDDMDVEYPQEGVIVKTDKKQTFDQFQSICSPCTLR